MNSEQLLKKLASYCDCVQKGGETGSTFSVNCPKCGPELVKGAFRKQFIRGIESGTGRVYVE